MFYSTDATSQIKEGLLLGLGNPLLDISINGDKDFLNKYGLLPNNAIIADKSHSKLFDDIVQNHNPFYIAGGATQNSIRVAQWLLQKPHATTFFGGVGDDKFKSILEEKAREVGVNVRYDIHPGEKTGVCAAIITGEDRSLVSELGAAQKFSMKFLENPDNWKFVEAADYFYIGGFLLPVNPKTILKIVKHAAENNKTVAMNLHATFLCHHFTDPDLGIMQYIDVLFGNGDEAAEFSKLQGFSATTVEEMAKMTADLPKVNPSRKRLVVFTQGKLPTYLAQGGTVSEFPIEPVDSSIIKDTNGCGDSFVGGFLSQLVQGKPVGDCMRCGSYAAKVVLQHYGCTFPEKPDFK
ncbi:adenosine kinase-like [Gigantopelta aegis]|uniref:adenosine kinase-like n=1 Tax=Gigantopelta aegis TaxID=1735272 RepID=UPI001B88DBDD|nr:adenosine kinase-like [Gigantopelta aegis]